MYKYNARTLIMHINININENNTCLRAKEFPTAMLEKKKVLASSYFPTLTYVYHNQTPPPNPLRGNGIGKHNPATAYSPALYISPSVVPASPSHHPHHMLIKKTKLRLFVSRCLRSPQFNS